MCGIFGITLDEKSSKRASETIVKGLKTLEYRGYDSVGIAMVTDKNGLLVRKGRGSLSTLTVKLGFKKMPGKTGIGHTRWATHGAPTDENAHPHTDCKKSIAVVHNGIIKNYLKLKKTLIEKKHVFKSETDTEVVPHLVEENFKQSQNIFDAFKKSVESLEGSFALAMVTSYAPNHIFFAKRESPLVIGIMDEGMILASDIPAILEYTNKVIVVTENEVGWITPREIYLEKEGAPTFHQKRIIKIEWKASMAKKGGYPHYMIKEIHEQPIALKATYDGLLSDETLSKVAEIVSRSNRVFLTAAGTSYHAGLVTKYFIENLAGIMVYPFISSEYKSIEKIVRKNDVLIAISQSGETIDTLKALRTFKEHEGTVIAVTNVLGSAINREADYTITMRAGPEIGVAATKTFLTQVLAGELLAVKLGMLTGGLTENEAKEKIITLSKAPRITAESISLTEKEARSLSTRMAEANSAYFLGRGLGFPLALEGALKMKEISYIHAEAYPAGESKHGPIAIVEEDYPVIFLVTTDSVKEIRNNIAEMDARDALTITIVSQEFEKEVDGRKIVMTPRSNLLLEPFSLTPPFQLLSYYTATRLGYNPDKPRNLAKTVTVE